MAFQSARVAPYSVTRGTLPAPVALAGAAGLGDRLVRVAVGSIAGPALAGWLARVLVAVGVDSPLSTSVSISMHPHSRSSAPVTLPAMIQRVRLSQTGEAGLEGHRASPRHRIAGRWDSPVGDLMAQHQQLGDHRGPAPRQFRQPAEHPYRAQVQHQMGSSPKFHESRDTLRRRDAENERWHGVGPVTVVRSGAVALVDR
jgi:hypothetical protein